MGAEFDEYADEYAEALGRGLSASGEDKDYFARGRVDWLRRCLAEMQSAPRLQSILDYGCGDGSTMPLLESLAPDAELVGVDVSARSLAVAERRFGHQRRRFALVAEHAPPASYSLSYANGIFHHIPPGERAAAARYVYDCLGPGGLFSFWENNPWNPGTRWVMSRIPFDADAEPLSVLEARQLLTSVGFRVLRTDFLFIFPRPLKMLRMLEPMLARYPLGAQYQILCAKR